jgi:signal transduction histidine kinase/ligand-binding sensor domain-containing protein
VGAFVWRLIVLLTAAARRLSILAAVAFLAGAPANALDPARSMAQFHHTSWSLRDGVPTAVTAIAQTPDGFLWLGSASGLYRFDGVRAEPFGTGQPLRGLVFSMATSDDGDLWLGFDSARIARVRHGEVTSFIAPTAGLRSPVWFLAPDRDGGIWVSTRDTVLKFDGQRWRAIGSPWPAAATWSDPGGVWGLAVGRDGTIWVKNLLGLYFLRQGAEAFEPAPGYAGGLIDFACDRDGQLWTADFASKRFYALPDLDPGQPVAQPDFGAAVPATVLGSVLVDRDGSLWNGNKITGGLYRIASLAASTPDERFTVPQGLSSDIINAVFEDREGDIWVATSRGIDRFRHANVVAEPNLALRPQAPQLVATEEAVFLYSGMVAPVPDPNDVGGRLYRMRPGQTPELVVPNLGQVEAMAATPDGDIVFASEGKLLRWRNGLVTPIAIPPDMAGGHVNNLVATGDGGLWVSIYGKDKGVYRFASGRWTHITPPSAPPGDAPFLVLDGAGAAWMFYPGGLIARVDGERTAEFRSVEAEVGTIRATLADSGGFILVGDQGLARFDGRDFQFLPASRAPVLALGFGIVQTADGDVWLGTATGIVRIARTALLKAFADPQMPLEFQYFDADDGFTGSPPRDVFNGAMVAGPEGRIWFLLPSSATWIDPEHLYRNPEPPPVVITSVTASGRSYDMPGSLSLPAGVSQLQIDYTALSLAMPERVRFRYMFTGVDPDWIDAGTRRQAFYTNVPPGDHRFQVIAANNDGVWNTTGATLAVTIAPTFLQSIWFKFLVALVIAGLAWLTYAMRLRQQAARLQSRFDIRIAERERIARELHDTLLQGFQGLMLRFQSAANRAPVGGELRASLDEALDRADAVLVEGRARVRDLRATATDDDLAKAIVDTAHKIIETENPHFHLTVEGSPRILHALVGEEVARIAEEAIRNSVQHAEAKAIEAILSYGRRELRLTIRDDGVGMPSSILTTGEKAGHYGLLGMRERAQRIGGRLEVSSREGAGTEIVLSVSGRAAYRNSRSQFFGWLRPPAPRSSA